MKIKELRPIRETTSDYDAIEAEIKRVFREEIYLPLLKDLGGNPNKLSNSEEDVIDALTKGKISFHRGKFTGKFNARLSRELRAMGARFKDGAFHIPASDLSPDLRMAIAGGEDRFLRAVKKMEQTLAKILPENIAEKMNLSKYFDRSIYKVDRELTATMKAIAVPSKLTPKRAKMISDGYTNDLKRYIKDFTDKEILELREKIKINSMRGGRYESMVKTIQQSYDVSANKAKFLARQETSLMMTKFKEGRYTDAGVREYRWGCVVGSANHPVRPMHKALEGKIFSWSEPPITSPTGDRNNPGQDYNCRCYARPIVKF